MRPSSYSSGLISSRRWSSGIDAGMDIGLITLIGSEVWLSEDTSLLGEFMDERGDVPGMMRGAWGSSRAPTPMVARRPRACAIASDAAAWFRPDTSLSGDRGPIGGVPGAKTLFERGRI